MSVSLLTFGQRPLPCPPSAIVGARPASHVDRLALPISSPLRLQSPGDRHAALHQTVQTTRARRRAPVRPAAASLAAFGQAVVENYAVRDAIAMTVSIFGAKALVGFFETLEERNIIDKNLSRKLVHTLAGPLFLACWPLFSPAPAARLVAAVVPTLNAIRLVLAGTETIPDPRAVAAMTRTGHPAELLRGPLYYVIVLQIVTMMYWRSSPVGLVVISLMCGGDGLADIVGRRWGKNCRLPWNQEKSWAGSAAMFLGGLGASAALLWYYSALGYLTLSDVPATAAAVTAIAAVATSIESLPINKTLDDNVSVPGVAAAMGVALLHVPLI